MGERDLLILVIRLTGRLDASDILCEIAGTVELGEDAKATRSTLIRIDTVRDDRGLLPAKERGPGGKIAGTATLGYLQEVLINIGYLNYGDRGYGVSFGMQPKPTGR